ncbi:NfeD family protein [Labilibaculum sp.]|uniref:NfeD family protein n=1 Tax=Labilibaculum sp. TaxID=2060723 RepID=UPI003561C0F4
MDIEIWHIFLVLSTGLFTIEIFKSTFLFASFGLVFSCCALFCFLEPPIWTQFLFFSASIITCLFLFKSFQKNSSTNKTKQSYLELQALIGKKAIVSEEINQNMKKGSVQMLGSTWRAKSEFGEVISKDSFVEVLKIGKSSITVKIIPN